MEARQLENIRFEFNSFDQVRKELQKLFTEEYTFDRFCSFRDWVMANDDYLRAMANKMTMAQIKKIINHRPDDKKGDLVNRLVGAVTGTIDITAPDTESYVIDFSPGGMERQKAQRAEEKRQRLLNIKVEDYEKERAERMEARAALRKALDNPETMEEFKTFIRYRGEGAMTTEQRGAYDTLMADTIKERRQAEEERKAVVKQVDIGDVKMELKNSRHTKKDIPLWVVQLNDRVESDVYKELNARAKQLGGYYSSYRGQGAIPGFIFEDEKSALLFMKVKETDVDASEIREEEQEEKTQSRAESLRAKANKLIEDGEEELNRERKTNTYKRAREASHAEAKAEHQIKFGKTLLAIADGLDAGTISYLENISAITELDLLWGLLSNARHRLSQATGERYDSIDRNDPRLVDHVKYPYVYMYRGTLEGKLLQLADVDGKKLASARLLKKLKRIGENESYELKYSGDIQDYKDVLCTRDWRDGSILDEYDIKRYKEVLLDYQRVHDRLKLTTIYELRAALRELLSLRHGAGKLTPEQERDLKIRELERQFVGKRIEGFFPTPEALAREVVEKANIEPGMSVLEPSAGLGHLADIIMEVEPECSLVCMEQYVPLAEALRLKGYAAVQTDFLQEGPREIFDRIVMNPPFENQADIDHVLHAFEFLKPEGRLVAIMSTSWTFRDNAKSVEFREFVGNNGTWEQNEEGAFKSAFRPTGVATVTVTLDK